MSLIDKIIVEIDCALRVCVGAEQGARKSPAADVADVELRKDEAKLSARLMRVNHCGEVCAQALYRGQALVARDMQTRSFLLHAATEEVDHLNWTRTRVKQLNSRTSLLDPVFYALSATIGTVTGVLGDKLSLGFVDETEQQVERHLASHLQKLPRADLPSRAIVKQMQVDESEHAANARAEGGAALPKPLQCMMHFMGRVMTSLTYWV